jgi:hypothetical protein
LESEGLVEDLLEEKAGELDQEDFPAKPTFECR